MLGQHQWVHGFLEWSSCRYGCLPGEQSHQLSTDQRSHLGIGSLENEIVHLSPRLSETEPGRFISEEKVDI